MKHVANWAVNADHPGFSGHFPGTPILPGVVLLDVVLQMIAKSCGIAPQGWEISSVKFLSPALPGDELQILHFHTSGGPIRFDIVSGMRKIASGSITVIP